MIQISGKGSEPTICVHALFNEPYACALVYAGILHVHLLCFWQFQFVSGENILHKRRSSQFSAAIDHSETSTEVLLVEAKFSPTRVYTLRFSHSLHTSPTHTDKQQFSSPLPY